MSIADDTEKIGRELARRLLEIGAVKLQPEHPFRWSSGWQSPIYCDNRLTLSYPDLRSFIKRGLSSLLSLHFPTAETIAGVATAGIPQGALVADILELPFVYVRSKPKGHGMENLIEGKVPEGRKVVVIEDLVSTGGSSLKAAEALRKAGAEVLGMVSIFTYGFPQADANFAQAGLPLFSMSHYNWLIEEALSLGMVSETDLTRLQAWRQDPANWLG
jgi:orotate phosphoribosyltransferase